MTRASLNKEKVREYRARKAQKPKPAAKTSVTLDVKPWGESHCIPYSSR